ncbi:hypothetical protein B5X24_HaOG214690 [Helicoverpa armigera]|nr:hypothetical protein B5X24_HaOG214690 [Helicoverpa armigera]
MSEKDKLTWETGKWTGRKSADDGALECRSASGTLSPHLLRIVFSRVRVIEALTDSTSSEAFHGFFIDFYRATNRGRYQYLTFPKRGETKAKPVMAGRIKKIEMRI